MDALKYFGDKSYSNLYYDILNMISSSLKTAFEDIDKDEHSLKLDAAFDAVYESTSLSDIKLQDIYEAGYAEARNYVCLADLGDLIDRIVDKVVSLTFRVMQEKDSEAGAFEEDTPEKRKPEQKLAPLDDVSLTNFLKRSYKEDEYVPRYGLPISFNDVPPSPNIVCDIFPVKATIEGILRDIENCRVLLTGPDGQSLNQSPLVEERIHYIRRQLDSSDHWSNAAEFLLRSFAENNLKFEPANSSTAGDVRIVGRMYRFYCARSADFLHTS